MIYHPFSTKVHNYVPKHVCVGPFTAPGAGKMSKYIFVVISIIYNYVHINLENKTKFCLKMSSEKIFPKCWEFAVCKIVPLLC